MLGVCMNGRSPDEVWGERMTVIVLRTWLLRSREFRPLDMVKKCFQVSLNLSLFNSWELECPSDEMIYRMSQFSTRAEDAV